MSLPAHAVWGGQTNKTYSFQGLALNCPNLLHKQGWLRASKDPTRFWTGVISTFPEGPTYTTIMEIGPQKLNRDGFIGA